MNRYVEQIAHEILVGLDVEERGQKYETARLLARRLIVAVTRDLTAVVSVAVAKGKDPVDRMNELRRRFEDDLASAEMDAGEYEAALRRSGK